MTSDERANIVWVNISYIADDDPRMAMDMINVKSAPAWLVDKLAKADPYYFNLVNSTAVRH